MHRDFRLPMATNSRQYESMDNVVYRRPSSTPIDDELDISVIDDDNDTTQSDLMQTRKY
jgi:hypothetical protein